MKKLIKNEICGSVNSASVHCSRKTGQMLRLLVKTGQTVHPCRVLGYEKITIITLSNAGQDGAGLKSCPIPAPQRWWGGENPCGAK